MNGWRQFRIKTHAVTFSLMLALFFFFALNIPLISRLYEIGLAGGMKTGFIVSIPFFFIAAFNVLFLPFSATRIAKPLFISLTFFSAAVSHATYNYGIIFSKEMIMNVAETDYAEASSYLNVSAAIWLFFLGILPSLLIYKTQMIALPARRRALYYFVSATASLSVVAITAVFCFQDYAVTLRNHSDLKRIIVPTYAASGSYKFIREKYFTEPLP